MQLVNTVERKVGNNMQAKRRMWRKLFCWDMSIGNGSDNEVHELEAIKMSTSL